MMGKKPAGVLMFLLVILKVLGTAETCRCSTSSSPFFPPSYYCSCVALSLTSVPQNLSTTITSLNLEGNQITTLTYDVLSSLSDVSLDNNPWQCDCCFEPKIVRFERSDSMVLAQGEDLLEQLVCEASGIPTPTITIIPPSGLNATVEFTLPVFVGSVSGAVAGTIVLGAIFLTIWRRTCAKSRSVALDTGVALTTQL
ncbi:Protein sidekick-2 [Branchiostoma belcheri]|nr:Protein sidekick-2 [Branchiostoma belcheri]